MAIASTGYAGSVNALQWARMNRYHGSRYAVADRAAFACAQIGTTKTFSLAPGEAYASGVLDTSNASETVSPTVPGSGGRWFLICLRRSWSARATTIVAHSGPTTSTSVPTAAPTSMGFITSNPGVTDDQPLFWVWVNASTTQTVIVDVRDLPVSVPRKGTAAERDAYYGTINPASTAGQRYLQRIGAQWQNTDLRYFQEYLGTFESSENFHGVLVAGWYPTQGARPSIEFWTVAKALANNSAVVVGSTAHPWDGGVDRFGWMTALGRFQPNLPGLYRMRVQNGFAGAAGANVQTQFRLNGSAFTVIAGRNAFDDYEQYLNGTTDYLEVVAYQNSGAAQNVRHGLVRFEYVAPERVAIPGS